MRLVMLILGAFCLLITPIGFANTEHHAEKPAAVKEGDLILVYAEPHSNANAVQKVSPSHRLIPIFRRGEWVKVGDPSDGKVGWINCDQYRKVTQAFYSPNIQTVFIRTEHDNNGKPSIDVVAYKNGKKLSKQEADALYKRIRNKQVHEARYMSHMFWTMNRSVDRQMREMNEFMAPWDNVGFGFAPEIIQPVIVVNPQHQAAPAEHNRVSGQDTAK